MTSRSIYHFIGSSYAEHVGSLLRQLAPQYLWTDVARAEEVPVDATVLLSPTPNNEAEHFLQQLSSTRRAVLLLDYNHIGFNDVQRLATTGRVNWALSPFQVPGLRTRNYPGLSLLESRSWRLGKAQDTRDCIFISQPLREDGRPGPDQFDLLRLVLELGRNVYVKRHPRETSPLPTDIDCHARYRPWTEDMPVAYARFHHWYGLNSLPLYVAKDLGRDVHIWHAHSASFLPMPSLQSIVETSSLSRNL